MKIKTGKAITNIPGCEERVIISLYWKVFRLDMGGIPDTSRARSYSPEVFMKCLYARAGKSVVPHNTTQSQSPQGFLCEFLLV